MNHTTLLNYLIQKHGLKSYLEIGVRTTAQNFEKITAHFKYGIDPDPNSGAGFKMTSDEYFNNAFNNKDYMVYFDYADGRREWEPVKYDLIFIDGDHTASQVERDFNNSLRCLNDGGFIVIHDVLPDKEEFTKVPRETKQWFGDVYKFAMRLGAYRDYVDFRTVNIDCGCTVVWKGKAVMEKINGFVSWETYLRDRNCNMRIIEESEIETYLPKAKEAAM